MDQTTKIKVYKQLGMTDEEISKRLKEQERLQIWEEKTLSKKPKFEKIAAFGPILSAIAFILIISTVVLTAIPPIENFVREHLLGFAIFLGSTFLIATIGFILGQINIHNETYHSLLAAKHQCQKWKDQLK